MSPREQRLKVLCHSIDLLNKEVEIDKWEVQRGKYVVKGCTGTRGATVFIHSDVNELDKFIISNCNKYTVKSRENDNETLI